MVDATALERELRDYRPAVGLGKELGLPLQLVWPRYEGRSVGNLAATVGQALGVPLSDVLPPLSEELLDGMLDGVKRVVLLVMDALGWQVLQRAMAEDDNLVFHHLAARGRLLPLTTTFLSTTDSVLSVIWTGCPPVRHGLLAYELYLREWMMAVEAIGFSSPFAPFSNTLLQWGFDPEAFLPVPTLAQKLTARGVPTYSVIHKGLTSTPLSRMHFRGAKEVRGHSYGSDFWLTLRRVLSAQRGGRMLLAGYWSAVDTLAHKFGPEDESGEVEIRSIAMLMEDIFVRRLAPEDREGTLLLMTADHGQIHTPAESTIVMQDHPALLDSLWLPPLGEGRVPFFYVRDGAFDDVWAYLHEAFGAQFTFVTRSQLLESGLLGTGPIYREVPFRLGDIIGIANGDGAFARTKEDAERLSGRHGGLTAEEMLVPLLAVRLEQL
jgi:hypothetical protein